MNVDGAVGLARAHAKLTLAVNDLAEFAGSGRDRIGMHPIALRTHQRRLDEAADHARLAVAALVDAGAEPEAVAVARRAQELLERVPIEQTAMGGVGLELAADLERVVRTSTVVGDAAVARTRALVAGSPVDLDRADWAALAQVSRARGPETFGVDVEDLWAPEFFGTDLGRSINDLAYDGVMTSARSRATAAMKFAKYRPEASQAGREAIARLAAGDESARAAALTFFEHRSHGGKFAVSRMEMAAERLRMAADPAVDRASVSDELAQLLAVPHDELTIPQMTRIGVIAGLPAHLRPPMPGTYTMKQFDNLGWPDDDVDALRGIHAETIGDIRSYFAAVVDPDGAARQLRASIDAGDQVDLRILSALEEHPGLLERHGISQDMLHAQALRALSGAGAARGGRDQLAHDLARVRDSVEAIVPAKPELAPVRMQALELADRNLDRMAGKRTDTVGRHPDYAEVGRFLSLATLLDAIEKSAPAVVDDAVDTIAW